jgi:tetratricopeptide (TPR) repeat protein
VPGLLNSLRWAFVRTPKTLETWSLDRNFNRAEAQRHLKSRNYAEAERYLLLAVQESNHRHQAATKCVRLHLELADVQRRVALMAMGSGRYPRADAAKLSEAEHTVRAAVSIAARASARESYVLCLDALTEVFGDQQKYPAMEKAAQEAIRLGAALSHPDPLRMARRVHWLGVARYHNGRVEEAMPALEKSLALHEENYGPDHLITAGRLSEIGRIYSARGQHVKAQDYLRRALRIHAAEYGPDSAQAFSDLAALAGSLEESGRLEAAAAEYERALVLKQRKLGVTNLDEVAEMQFSLANLYVGWDNFSRARELLTECIGTFRRSGGPRLAVAYETQAQLEERSGRFFNAVHELEKAGTAWRKSGRIAELVNNMEYRADLLEQLRKTKEASWLREQAAALLSENTSAMAGAS